MAPETTAPGTTGVDHLVVATRDLDAAGRQYERLGFRPTPRGEHSLLGSSNRCLMFRDGNYLELLAMTAPGRRPYYDAFLARREGAAGLGFRSAEAARTREAWAASGLAAGAVVEFGRPVELPQGRREARFATVEIAPGQTPEARLFACEQRTPDLVWLPDYLDHPNGVRGILGVSIVADDPAATATLWARATGAAPSREGDGLVLALGRTSLRFVTPAAARATWPGDPLLELAPPYVAALRLGSAEPDAAAACLARHGVGRRAGPPETLLVPSTEAVGIILEFIAA